MSSFLNYNATGWCERNFIIGFLSRQFQNEEFQFYGNDRSISFATNGILYIKPGIVYDQPGVLGPVKSARILSVNSFSFKYGKLEIRAKMPVGDWLWPGQFNLVFTIIILYIYFPHKNNKSLHSPLSIWYSYF